MLKNNEFDFTDEINQKIDYLDYLEKIYNSDMENKYHKFAISEIEKQRNIYNAQRELYNYLESLRKDNLIDEETRDEAVKTVLDEDSEIVLYFEFTLDDEYNLFTIGYINKYFSKYGVYAENVEKKKRVNYLYR